MPNYYFHCTHCKKDEGRIFAYGKASKSIRCKRCRRMVKRIIVFPKTRIPNWPPWAMPQASDLLNKNLEAAYNRKQVKFTDKERIG